MIRWACRGAGLGLLVASLVVALPGWLVVCVAVALVAEGVWWFLDSAGRTC